VGGLPSGDAKLMQMELIKEQMRNLTRQVEDRDEAHKSEYSTMLEAIEQLRTEGGERRAVLLRTIGDMLGAQGVSGPTPMHKSSRYAPCSVESSGALTLGLKRGLSRSVVVTPWATPEEDRHQDGVRDSTKQSAGRRVLVRKRREHSQHSHLRRGQPEPLDAQAPKEQVPEDIKMGSCDRFEA